MSAASARTQKAGNTVRFEGVTCPFCPLLCDDLVIEQSGNQIKTVDNACPRGKAAFEQPPKQLQPRIKGKAVSLDKAIEAAAGILRQSRQPLLSGLGTDVAGMRAAVALAEATHGFMDHMHGQALSNNYRVLQSRGWMTTTLSEIRNRADLVVFIGTDASQYHRFYERALFPAETLFEPEAAKRELVYVGNGLKSRPHGAPKGLKTSVLNCKPEQLGEFAGAANAAVLGQPLDNKVGSIKTQAIEQLAKRLQQAKYSVIVWAPGELPEDHGEAIIESLCNLIETLNATTRSSGFMLGGGNAGTTAANVTAWLTGYPLRISFARGYPAYDPVAYSTANVLKSGAADSVLWLSTFGADDSMPATGKLPSIVIADSDKAFNSEPDVFIPAAIPGIDHAGTLIRGDSVVSLPLQKVRDSDRTRAAEIIQAIHAKL